MSCSNIFKYYLKFQSFVFVFANILPPTKKGLKQFLDQKTGSLTVKYLGFFTASFFVKKKNRTLFCECRATNEHSLKIHKMSNPETKDTCAYEAKTKQNFRSHLQALYENIR